MHSTVQAEIIDINSLYLQISKSAGSFSGLFDLFVNYYDVEALCAFFTNTCFLIKFMVLRLIYCW